MKKLTAGIFATLLAVVSVGAAHAEIASKGYVDQQVGTKADKATVSSLQGTVSGHTSQINTINTTLEGKVDDAAIADMLTKTEASTTYYTQTAGTALEDRVDAVEAPEAEVAENVTGPVSGGTVYTAIQGVSGNVGTVTSDVAALKEDMTKAQTDISALEAASATHATQTQLSSSLATKQDKLTGPVGSATQPVYVNEGGNVVAGTAYGALATKSTVTSADITDGTIAEGDLNESINESLDKADTALQAAALADYVTTDAANAAYAVKTLEDQVGTVSKENMGTTNATTVVGGVKEAIDAAKAADTKAGQAQNAATVAQGEVDALEVVVNNETTGLAAAHTAIDALESGKLDTTGTAAKATADASGNVITATYATKTEIADLATDEDLALKQDKTDNTLATSVKTVVGAINEVKATADAAIPAPGGECAEPANKCVLTYNNTVYAWEVIARGTSDSSN